MATQDGWLAPQVLEGRVVRLEPYGEAVREGVKAALDVDPQAWNLFTRPGFGEHFDAWWAWAEADTARGGSLSFAVRRLADDRIVGTTSFLNIVAGDRKVEIGATFYHPDARASAVNPDAKRVLLAHAFAAGAHRVQLVTDLRNVRSQAAIAKLGAVREGVLRREKTTWTGHVRDTVVFSVLADEWAQMRAGLEARVG